MAQTIWPAITGNTIKQGSINVSTGGKTMIHKTDFDVSYRDCVGDQKDINIISGMYTGVCPSGERGFYFQHQ